MLLYSQEFSRLHCCLFVKVQTDVFTSLGNMLCIFLIDAFTSFRLSFFATALLEYHRFFTLSTAFFKFFCCFFRSTILHFNNCQSSFPSPFGALPFRYPYRFCKLFASCFKLFPSATYVSITPQIVFVNTLFVDLFKKYIQFNIFWLYLVLFTYFTYFDICSTSLYNKNIQHKIPYIERLNYHEKNSFF